MAIGTITIIGTQPLGDNGEKAFKCSFAGDGAYPTGGTLLAAINTALRDAIVDAAAAASDKLVRGAETPTIREIIAGDCGQYVPCWSAAVGLKVLDGGSGTRAEAAPGADLHLTTFNVTFICE